ncbi:MAG: RNA 2',3'-cyclic phosphodiesterase [Chloroflexota bacterium]|nr:MAG: RNA 2',3'-cyclic phosphodiesterase [Chloroflexota bacterium]
MPIREALAEAGLFVSEQLPPRAVRWVKPANIHLTLRFLGDTDLATLPQIGESLDQVASKFGPIDLRLGQLGCFPNARKPRVIWIGVNGDVRRLEKLHGDVEKQLQPLGWPPEGRRFHPHLTIGRAKDSRRVVAARLPWGEQLRTDSFTVANISLIESELQPTGAVYTTRHESVLAEPPEAQSAQ